MRHKEHTTDRRRDKYIGGEEEQAMMHQAREVCVWALPNCSHKADGSLGMDLTQEKRRAEVYQVGNGCWCRKCIDKMQRSVLLRCRLA